MDAYTDSSLGPFDDAAGNAAGLLPMAATPATPTAAPTASDAMSLHWTNRFESLGTEFFTRLSATPLSEPHWVARSESAAADLGLPADWWQRDGGSALQVLSGNAAWPGSHPLASVYSGHQFGQWAGQLGDGRAIWLGEIDTPNGPTELQLKGAGATPYSRMGDGRAVLRSSIREFLCSEAMHGLGIPTTRALCITGSQQPVRREEIETAAVVTRSAPSFIRFGHFEHFVHTAPDEGFTRLRRLADFVIDHHYPECRDADNPYAAFLEAVSRRTATLMAQWQAVGFCHGVMNTDNMSILGLTIDYGPFGFLDGFNPNFICNHTDTQGRYAYSQQPNVGFWNLHALAQALVPLIGDSDRTLAALEPYKAAFAHATMSSMRAKLGLATAETEDQALLEGFLKVMANGASDFTISFRRLALFDTTAGADNSKVRDDYLDLAGFDAWAPVYAERLRREYSVDAERALRMNAVNPKFVLRNHLAEVAIRQAKAGDFTEVVRLLQILGKPFDEQPEHEAYSDHPPEWAQQIEVSCSS